MASGEEGRQSAVVHCPAPSGLCVLGEVAVPLEFPPSSANGVKDIAQNAHCPCCAAIHQHLASLPAGRALPSLRGHRFGLSRAPHGHAQRLKWCPGARQWLFSHSISLKAIKFWNAIQVLLLPRSKSFRVKVHLLWAAS